MPKISQLPTETHVDGSEEIPVLAEGSNSKVSLNALRNWVLRHVSQQVNVVDEANTYAKSYPVKGTIKKGQGIHIIRDTDNTIKAQVARNEVIVEPRVDVNDFASNIGSTEFDIGSTKSNGVKFYPIRDRTRAPTAQEMGKRSDAGLDNRFITLARVTPGDDANWRWEAPVEADRLFLGVQDFANRDDLIYIKAVNIRENDVFVTLSADSSLSTNVRRLFLDSTSAILLTEDTGSDNSNYIVLANGDIEWQMGRVTTSDITAIIGNSGNIRIDIYRDSATSTKLYSSAYGRVVLANPIFKTLDTDVYRRGFLDIDLNQDTVNLASYNYEPSSPIPFRYLNYERGEDSRVPFEMHLESVSFNATTGAIRFQGNYAPRFFHGSLTVQLNSRQSNMCIILTLPGGERIIMPSRLGSGATLANFDITINLTDDQVELVADGEASNTKNLKFNIHLNVVPRSNIVLPASLFSQFSSGFSTYVNSNDELYGKFLPVKDIASGAASPIMDAVEHNVYYNAQGYGFTVLGYGSLTPTRLLVMGRRQGHVVGDRLVSNSTGTGEDKVYGFSRQEKALCPNRRGFNYQDSTSNNHGEQTFIQIWERRNNQWFIDKDFSLVASSINKNSGVEYNAAEAYASIFKLRETNDTILFGLCGNTFHRAVIGNQHENAEGDITSVDGSFPSSGDLAKKVVLLEFDKSTLNFTYVLEETEDYLRNYVYISELPDLPQSGGVDLISRFFALTYSDGEEVLRAYIGNNVRWNICELDFDNYNANLKKVSYTSIKGVAAFRNGGYGSRTNTFSTNEKGFKDYFLSNSSNTIYSTGGGTRGSPNSQNGYLYGVIFNEDFTDVIRETVKNGSYFPTEDWKKLFTNYVEVSVGLRGLSLSDFGRVHRTSHSVIRLGSGSTNFTAISIGQENINPSLEELPSRSSWLLGSFWTNILAHVLQQRRIDYGGNVRSNENDFQSVYTNLRLQQIDLMADNSNTVIDRQIALAIGVALDNYNDGDEGNFALFRGSTLISLNSFNLTAGRYYGLNPNTAELVENGSIRVGQAISETDIIVDR